MKKRCELCSLSETAVHSNCISGWGSKHPIWLFVGEAPGDVEDRLGKVFVGPIGRDLRALLFEELDFPQNQCRLTNACRCWPGQGNPTPELDQIKACHPYLKKEIEEVKPKVVVLMGNPALTSIRHKQSRITYERGMAWEEDGVIYVPTYHLSYVWRNFKDDIILGAFLSDLELAKTAATEGIKSKETPDWNVIESFDDAMDIIALLEDIEESIATDIETHGQVYDPDARVISWAWCYEPGWAFCIPLLKSHDCPYSWEKSELLLHRIGKMHRKRNERGLKMSAYSCVMEIKFPLSAHGITPPEFDFDPYLAHHLLNENLKKPSQKQLAWTYTELGGYEKPLTDYIFTHPEANPEKGGSYDNIPLEILGPYNAGDADICQRLCMALKPKLEEEGLYDFLREITLPASNVMAEFETNGLKLNRKFLSQLMSDYPTRMAEVTAKTRQLRDVRDYEQAVLDEMTRAEEQRQRNLAEQGRRFKPKKIAFKFNPGSGKQAKEILFGMAGLEPVILTPKKQPSLNEAAREILWDSHPLIPYLDQYEKLKKFFGSYVKVFNDGMDSEGIYHGFFDLTGTVTGRLSSNLQQIPRVGTNADIRRLFVSRFGDEGGMAELDVSQGELRMMCIHSKDSALRRIFREGKDAHSMAARWVYDLPEDEKEDSELRSRIKAGISFGLIYGGQAPSLAAKFGWSLEKAQEFIDRYFSIFSGVKEQGERFITEAIDQGFVRNLLGRKRRLPEIYSDNPAVRSHAQRQAINSPIQSILHDLMLFAEVKILEFFYENQMESLLCGEAHDSLIIDYHKSELDTVIAIGKGVLENLDQYFDWIDIPIVADVKVGPNLCDSEEVA